MTRFLLFISLAASATADRMPLSPEYWTSKTFLKEFNGSYRINANIEPILTSEERGLLVQMQDLMAKGKRTDTITKLKASPLLATSAAVQFNLANVLSEEAKLDDAETFYKKALAIFPSFLRAHQNLAFTYFRKKDLEKTREHLLQAIRLGANNGSVHGLLGQCFLESEEYEPAVRSFREALITQPKVRDWTLGIAQALQNLSRTEEALVIYEKILQEDPENTGILLQVALIYNDQDEPLKAVGILEYLRRREQLPNSFQLLLGTLLIGQENLEVGAATLKRVLEKEDFKKPDSALNAIQYCLEQDLTPLAKELRDLIREEDLSPNGLVFYKRMTAQIILTAKANDPEGLKILDALIAANPLDSHSLLIRAQQHLIAEERFKALLILDQTIHAQGAFSLRAQLEKAQLLVKLQRYSEAITELKGYLESRPDETRVQEYLEAVEDLNKAYSVGSK